MRSIFGAAAAALLLSSCALVLAQDDNEPPPSLRNLLITKYKLTKTAYGPAGTQVVDAGPVFVIRKGGLFGVLPQAIGKCQAQFKGGDLKPPIRFCTASSPKGRFLDTGERVFLTKLDVNSKRNTITVDFMECDACNGVQQTSSLKSSVVFDFPAKFLDNAAPGQVSDVIDQVLGPDQGGAPLPAAATQASQPDAAPQSAQQQPQGQIKKGDSPAQVEAAMGPPDTKINLAPKMVYVYKSLNLKVVFVNDQVTDIQ